MDEFIRSVTNFGITRLAAIIGIGAGVSIALALIVFRLSEPQYSVLYAELSLEEAQEITTQLEQESVPFELKERNGSFIVLTPSSENQRLRLSLASNGFVATQGVGYEIFDRNDSFGSTTFQQNINRLRALEGELARTIATISTIQSARVHLVLPERELFTRDKKEARASIVITSSGNISKQTVRAIVNLAATAVPNLAPSNVTVLGSDGELLASGSETELANGPEVTERTSATEDRIRRTVTDILGRIVGPENLKVQVSAELDYSRVTESAEIIDPDSQTVLSSTTVEESSNDNSPLASRGVSVGNNLPGTTQADPIGNDASTSASTRTEETTNYEISRTVRNEVREQGGLKRLSVAVALNTPTETLADGTIAARPRTSEQLSRIRTLVASAIGFQANRGDTLEVIEAPFAEVVQTPSSLPGTIAQAAPAVPLDLARILEAFILLLVAIAIIYFVLNPLVRGQLVKDKSVVPTQNDNMPDEASAADALATLKSVAGKSEASLDPRRNDSVATRLTETVKENNDHSIGVLKSWIREAS